MITSTKNAEHYTWGNQCDGWHLLKSGSLSVIQERMPSGTAEQMHYHQFSQQVFYVLSGEATFIIEGAEHIVSDGQSIHIEKGVNHHIMNRSDDDLHFLVISEPKAHGDRINL